jgi:integrase
LLHTWGRTYENKIKGYTREEIQKMLEVVDAKYRAIILLLASTGMRRESCTSLKMSDLQNLPEHKMYMLRLYQWTPHEHVCFTTREAAHALDVYLRTKPIDPEPSI